MTRSFARRTVAALTGLWLVAFGFFGASHDAHHAHVVDARTGQVFHAAALAGHHTSGHADFHAAATSDHDACDVWAAVHQASRPAIAHALAAPTTLATIASATSIARTAIATRLVYRLAPKTSPPRAA